MKLMLGLILCAGLPSALAQTNATFQNCQAGDLVKVKCTHPLLVLGKATLLEIGSNTVTVGTASDRFTLAKTEVILLPRDNPSSPAAVASPASPPITSAAAAASNSPPGHAPGRNRRNPGGDSGLSA